MATTASDLLNTGTQFDINNNAQLGGAANAAISSSADRYGGSPAGQDYSAALISPGSYNGQPLKDAAVSSEQGQAFNPTLTPNTTFQYNPIQDASQYQLNYNNPVGQVSSSAAQGNTNYAAMPQVTDPAQYNATQVGAGQAGYNQLDPNAGHVNAAQGQVDPNSLIQNQFKSILDTSNKDANGVPDFARTAVTAAQQQMNAAGLGNSTMAANATAGAILNVALPMAQFNAQQYANMNTLNVSNQQQANIVNANNSLTAATANLTAAQQTSMANLQAYQQTLLADASWDNAAKQFNSQSKQQNDQFFSNLTSQIATQNAAQANAMSQFNAGQSNSMTQFLDNLNSQRDEFNTQNQLLTDQSNVQWRRTINTANTAGQNATNQANVMNTFNMQQTSLNNLWQQARDEASWALSSSENSQNRALTLVNSALNRQTSLQILSSQLSASMYSQLGAFGVNVLGGLLGGSGASGIGQGISNLFGGSGGFGGGGDWSTTSDPSPTAEGGDWSGGSSS